MDGMLIIDKPAGITSHDVVSRVRRILNMRRVGHTGTLDPFATGVMVILVGQATRLAQFLDKADKEYEAVVRFGFETDTGDHTGTRRETAAPGRGHALTLEAIEEALCTCRGEIEQTPPMYSAKKVDGKKLYEHARRGEIIERKPVVVKIHELEIMSETPPLTPGQTDVNIRVVCSAGTYIRTLAETIGRKIGVGAHLAELRRTRAGKFSIEQSLTLEQLERLDDKQVVLVPSEQAVSHLREFVLSEDRIEKTKNGLATSVIDAEFKDGEPVQMLDGHKKLVAVGFYNKAENTVRPKVVLSGGSV